MNKKEFIARVTSITAQLLEHPLAALTIHPIYAETYEPYTSDSGPQVPIEGYAYLGIMFAMESIVALPDAAHYDWESFERNQDALLEINDLNLTEIDLANFCRTILGDLVKDGAVDWGFGMWYADWDERPEGEDMFCFDITWNLS